MPENETVIDILAEDDPAAATSLTIPQVARRWRCTPFFATRRLRELGIRLLRVPSPLRVRLADVEELEKQLTVRLTARGRPVIHTSHGHE